MNKSLLALGMVPVALSFSFERSFKWYGSCKHTVYFYAEGIMSLGVQRVYRYDGEETRSEIVTFELDDPSSVAAIGDRNVASVKYYGLDGREVANPSAGIYVKKVTFEDGTEATFKKAIR